MLASNFLQGLKSKYKSVVANGNFVNDLNPIQNANIKVEKRFTMTFKKKK